MENETGLRVRAIRTDNGGEYTSQSFNKFCADKGIMHQLTNPYTPEQNGVSERLNRTLIESARSMLYHAKTPLKFWAESMNTAAYLRNRSPTSALKDKKDKRTKHHLKVGLGRNQMYQIRRSLEVSVLATLQIT